jgi:hypothetical protein
MPQFDYEIFQAIPNGDPRWVGSFNSLIEAQQRIIELKTSTPDEEYAIFDLQSSRFIQGFSKSASASN